LKFFASFLPLILVAYIISIGFGMIVAQGRGVAAVNRFWVRSIRSVARGIFRLISRIFGWIASLF
jgi:hypothetical protein